MAALRIQQTRSTIGCKKSQRDTLRTLGLHRIGDVVTRDDVPEVRGMVQAVRHLVSVTETVGEK